MARFVEGESATRRLDGEPDEDYLVIDTEPAACEYIRERGGRLFVWLEPIGGRYVKPKVATSSPPIAVEFDEIDTDEFTLYLQRDFNPPQIRLRRRRLWPFQPIDLRTGLEVSWSWAGAEGGME